MCYYIFLSPVVKLRGSGKMSRFNRNNQNMFLKEFIKKNNKTYCTYILNSVYEVLPKSS